MAVEGLYEGIARTGTEQVVVVLLYQIRANDTRLIVGRVAY